MRARTKIKNASARIVARETSLGVFDLDSEGKGAAHDSGRANRSAYEPDAALWSDSAVNSSEVSSVVQPTKEAASSSHPRDPAE